MSKRFIEVRSVVLFAIIFVFAFIHNGLVTAQAIEKSDQAALQSQFINAASKYWPGDESDISQFEFKAQSKTFGHLQRPWATYERNYAGHFGFNQQGLSIYETVQSNSNQSETKTFFSLSTLFQCDSDGRAKELTVTDHQQFLRYSCRYSPAMLLRHIENVLERKGNSLNKNSIAFTSQNERLLVSGILGKERFEVQFTATGTLTDISWSLDHEMWGDQDIEFQYTSEKTQQGHVYPTQIQESSFGVTTFRTEILSVGVKEFAGVERPEDYHLQTAKPVNRTIEIDKFSDRVTFLHLPHCESRTTLVEFDTFLMVIDAPISSQNGKLILDKIVEMKPKKPIKYFTFGHHHPHYLGGVRPFIANETTILTTKKIKPYLQQIVAQQHTIEPDELQQHPRELLLQTFEDKVEIAENGFEVQIYDIGLKSKHTIDYLLYYFPEEKMVLQDDGIWLRDGRPVNDRTRATFAAITDLKLDVVDCIQGWPTQNASAPTKLKFQRLKKYVEADIED